MTTPDRTAAPPGAAADLSPAVLKVSRLSKHFGGVQALREVSLSLQPGKVLALVGENGAGKSTLINIISGLFAPDDGSVELEGKPLPLGQTHHALRRGIVAVHQELTLFSHLTVWQNIFAGHEISGRVSRRLRPKSMIEASSKLLSQLRAQIDPAAPVHALTLAEQQLVELAKALSWNPRILILDEVTSALDAHQVESVFALVRTLKEQQVAIVLVSHRMPEVLANADQAVVLRDGAVVATFQEMTGVQETELVEKMVGRALSDIFPPKTNEVTETPVLEVEKLTSGLLAGISLAVRKGEIVGLGGLQGHGQAELLRILFGAAPSRSGKIRVRERQRSLTSPGEAMDAGIAYVPPDRKTEGLFLAHSVEFNLTISLLRWLLSTHLGILRANKEVRTINDLQRRLHIVQRQWQQTVENLSGGNQQKVVLGKWLDTPFDLLLLDEPTRGIDVATKGEIYRLLRELARQGKAVLLASTDSLELLGLCDRVYVFYEGQIQRELQGAHLNEYELTLATMGTATEGGSHA